MKTGKINGSVCLRILNIDVEQPFDLADGVRFQKLSRDEVQAKYPLDRRFTPVSEIIEEHWLIHRVEAVIPFVGSAAEFQELQRVEKTGAIINSLLHAFLLTEVPRGRTPGVTHIVFDSPLESSCHLHGIGSIAFQQEPLTADEVAALRESYEFLTACGNDRVLQTAVDRFILGRKRSEHHPNWVNEPNWDKIVDYVIAMETLFLTVGGNAVSQELGYRFRLNGSSLLAKCSSANVREVFHALKDLYEIRSKVVHGSDDATVLKAANKFISQTKIDDPNRQHSLGRMMLVSEQVEQWLKAVLFYLGSLPVADRPYRKPDGWEAMLWGAQ